MRKKQYREQLQEIQNSLINLENRLQITESKLVEKINTIEQNSISRRLQISEKIEKSKNGFKDILSVVSNDSKLENWEQPIFEEKHNFSTENHTNRLPEQLEELWKSFKTEVLLKVCEKIIPKNEQDNSEKKNLEQKNELNPISQMQVVELQLEKKTNNFKLFNEKQQMMNMIQKNSQALTTLRILIDPLLKCGQIQKLIEEEKQTKIHEQLLKTVKERPESIINPSTPYYNSFQLHENVITKTKDEGYQILFNVQLKQRKRFRMETRLKSLPSRSILIGVVDQLQQSNKKYSFDSGNAICFSGRYGNIHYGENGKWKYKKTGDTLIQNSSILMEIDFPASLVTFTFQTINGKMSHSVRSNLLMNQNYQFVPYYEILDVGDSVSWQIL